MVFDEEIDRKQMNVVLLKGSKSIAEEEIESDQEKELVQDDEDEQKH